MTAVSSFGSRYWEQLFSECLVVSFPFLLYTSTRKITSLLYGSGLKKVPLLGEASPNGTVWEVPHDFRRSVLMMDFALGKKKTTTTTFGSGRGPTSLQPFESSKDAHFQRKSAMVTKLSISSVRRSDTGRCRKETRISL